jgi:hypothetical protein
MVSHDHLEYVVLWQHKPEGCLGRETLRDSLNVTLNEVSEAIHV